MSKYHTALPDSYFSEIKTLCGLGDARVMGPFDKIWQAISKDNPISVDRLMMLVYENGGYDLATYILSHLLISIKNIITEPNNGAVTKTKVRNFFLSFMNLFEGLKAFRSCNIMHGDIKSDNIVYDEIEGKAKFIDFGAATSAEKIKECIITRGGRKIDEQIQVSGAYGIGAPYINPVEEITNLVEAVEEIKPGTLVLPEDLTLLISEVIERSDLYMFCQELRLALNDIVRGVNTVLQEEAEQLKGTSFLDYYIGLRKFLIAFRDELLVYGKRNYKDINTLPKLITDYQALLERTDIFKSSSGGYKRKHSEFFDSTDILRNGTGGYKRKTKIKRKSNRIKSNRRKSNRIKSNRRKSNKINIKK